MSTTTNGYWTGKRVRALRKRLGLTQIEFAAKLGVSFASVNRWENEQNKPTKLAVMRMEELANGKR